MSEFSGSNQARRLPIYLLLDTSGSMAGAPIQAVDQGVNLLYRELLNDPQAIETVHIAIITFDSQAKMLQPLTSIGSFSPPRLSANGTTAMGAALNMLGNSLDKDLVQNTANQRGDYKPLIFMLTDGEPTDNWEREADAIKNRSKSKIASLIAIGCGGGVNVDTLKRIGDTVLMMDNLAPENLMALFKWVSASVAVASASVGAAGAALEPTAKLPAPPSGINVVF